MNIPKREVWHLSRGYSENWNPYCLQEHRRGMDFLTFSTEHVTCGYCYEVACESWGRETADKYAWAIG